MADGDCRKRNEYKRYQDHSSYVGRLFNYNIIVYVIRYTSDSSFNNCEMKRGNLDQRINSPKRFRGPACTAVCWSSENYEK